MSNANLLEVAKTAATAALNFLNINGKNFKRYSYEKKLPKEMKSDVDYQLEKIISDVLMETSLPILSEESVDKFNKTGDKLNWVIDPLDGTVNFIRGIASCGISIALLSNNKPVFGVICEYPSQKLYWGGKQYGAFCKENILEVSKIDRVDQALICTGFPSRFDFTENSAAESFTSLSKYNKVRMLGAASLSLVQVAKGTAEVYREHNIMLWDVAAGLAILEGAGGRFVMRPSRYEYSYNIFASNGLINE